MREARLVAQLTGDGALELWPGLVQGSEAGLERSSVLRGAGRGHVVIVLLLLESSEVILNEEGGIELANSHFFL